MSKKHKINKSSQIDISFCKHNEDQIDHQDSHLKVQILRVKSIEHQRTAHKIWTLTQQQLCQFFLNYNLFPQNYLSLDMLVDSPRLKLVKTDGKVYFGQIQRKQRQGWGLLIDKSGQIYQGWFANNQKRGQGIEVYSNSNLYIGQFQNNKKHGKGTFYWFSLSPRHSKTQVQTQCYDGDWWGGLPDGHGVHIRINGDYYIGGFKNGLKHGQGEQRYGNGDHYTGQFVNGLPQGYGQYSWNDGSSYKGDFKQGLRDGFGSWKANLQAFESYQGHYKSDKKDGYGVYVWDNGWTYRGNFQNDYRNGYGQLYDGANKISYKGSWQNGSKMNKQSTNNQFFPDNPQHNNYNQHNQDLSNQTSFRNVQFVRKGSANFSSPGVRYNSGKVQSAKKYNRSDIGEYATVSTYGNQMLSKRPEFNSTAHNSNNGKSIRIREQIGTKINRPLAPGPSAIMSRNAKSTKKF